MNIYLNTQNIKSLTMEEVDALMTCSVNSFCKFHYIFTKKIISIWQRSINSRRKEMCSQLCSWYPFIHRRFITSYCTFYQFHQHQCIAFPIWPADHKRMTICNVLVHQLQQLRYHGLIRSHKKIDFNNLALHFDSFINLKIA